MSPSFDLAGAVGLFRVARDVRRFKKTFRKYRDFTMVPEDVYVGNLRLASTVMNVPGEVVECGTWRGGMIAGIADVLGPNRRYRLFDSFEGLPPAREIDGKAALEWQKDTRSPWYFDNCRASEEEARAAMSMSGAKDYSIAKGWFRDTLPRAPAAPIALLRLDADWYDSTKEILDVLAERVVPGGLILVDDYYFYDGCALAVNEFAASHKWMVREYWLGNVCHVVIR